MVIGIFGPTASGKSDVAAAVAEIIPSELISADAMQVYRGLPILTNQSAQPTKLVGMWGLDHEASVGAYQELAHRAIDEALARGTTPIVVGGTGLYLRAALASLALPPQAPVELRERMERLYERLGSERAHRLLARRDPAAAARVHPNDRRRVVRALELAEVGGSLAPAADALWRGDYRRPTIVFGLELPRERLTRRIEERTQRMFAAGVQAEVARALRQPLSRTARTIHGLREIAELSREEAIDAYNRRVRRYAAYQRKWMRRIPGVVIIDADRSAQEVATEILQVAGARQHVSRDGPSRADPAART